MNDAAIALFAKAPEPGRVKTRLVPPLTMEDAARVARASLEDTARYIVPEVPVPWTLFLDGEADSATSDLAREAGMRILPQEGPELGVRLKAAFRVLREQGARRVLAIGSDSPTLDPERIREAIESLAVCELTLGPTEDGGYYLIGMTRIHPELFDDVPWGTADVLRRTQEIAAAIRLNVDLLPMWYDVDHSSDLQRVLHRRAEGDSVGHYTCAWLKEALRAI